MTDQVHPEIMVTMRNSVAKGSGKDVERAMSDEEILEAVDRYYDGGVDGYCRDLGATAGG